MSSFKKDDKVVVDFRKAPDTYGLPSGVSKSSSYTGVMQDDDSVKFDVSVGGWGEDARCWHCPDECISLAGSLRIPISDMRRIYDIACDTWKERLKGMISPFDEFFDCSSDFAEEMLSSSTESQKPIVMEVLTNNGYKPKKDKSLKYFKFEPGSDRHLTTETHTPVYLRNGLASSVSMEFRELGFGCNYTPVLVDQDGNETKLNSECYLKFKLK